MDQPFPRDCAEERRAAMNRFFKCFVFLILLTSLFAVGHAEVSANLHAQKTYNSNKKLILLTYVDDSGAVCVPEDKQYATVRYDYKGKNLVRTSFYDAEDNLTNCAAGWAECRVEYNSRGYAVDKAYYDRHGMLTIGPEGYARQTNEYEMKSLLQTTLGQRQ